jgi:serine/threonine-protein kinase RsbW/non-specific serine/threonine protein kinase
MHSSRRGSDDDPGSAAVEPLSWMPPFWPSGLPYARGMAFRWADFILPSTLQLAPLLEVLLDPVSCRDQMAELQLGLQEALVNAVRHGNGCDPHKVVRIRRILTPRWMVWQIQDEGCGVPSHARCWELPERLEATDGRGLFLIHHCFDDVRWSGRGNRLQLAARRRAEGRASAAER